MPIINNSTIGSFELAFPQNETEQKTIADFLDKKTRNIRSQIEKIRKMIDLLKEKKEALISNAVTKGLNPNVRMKDSGVEWIGEIPEHWEVSKISYFFDIQLGKMLQPEPQSNIDTLENYVCALNVFWEKIEKSNLKQMWFSILDKEKYELQKGDLIVTEGGDAGTSCIWSGDDTPCYIQNAVHRVRSKGVYNNAYLYFWLYYLKTIGYIDLVCNKSTIAHFTKEKFSSSPFLMPLKDESNAIAEYLNGQIAKIDNTINKNKALIEKLAEYQEALITAAVTGKINVRGVNEDGK